MVNGHKEWFLMAMVLKNNLSSLSTLNKLNANSSDLAKSLKKVSSGMRINGAGDDSANFAISEKMRVRIRGLEQDARNLQSGMALVRVGLGGMEQIKENMASMRELALAAANDTMTDLDRQTSQKVVDQMIDNIDDIAIGTVFNGIHVLTGKPPVGVDVVFVVDITGSMGGIIRGIADGMGVFTDRLVSEGKDYRLGLISYGDIREGAIGAVDKILDFTSDTKELEKELRSLSGRVGGGGDEPESGLDGIMGALSMFSFNPGADKHIIVVTDASTLDAEEEPGSTEYTIGDVIAAAVEEGVIIDTVAPLGGHAYDEWSKIQEGTNGTYCNVYGDYGKELSKLVDTFESVDAYIPLYIQDGTKANQNITIAIYDHKAASLGLVPLSICTQVEANSSLSKIDKALDKVLDRATTYGSYINRMEAAFSNVTTGTENTQASESIIRDADMAKEMVDYVKHNVLSQTAQSMLSQSNQNISSVLGLLQ